MLKIGPALKTYIEQTSDLPNNDATQPLCILSSTIAHLCRKAPNHYPLSTIFINYIQYSLVAETLMTIRMYDSDN